MQDKQTEPEVRDSMCTYWYKKGKQEGKDEMKKLFTPMVLELGKLLTK